MAAAGGCPVRLRLLFDYPPPGSPGCALCWLLLEPSQVRLVTDLISLIRHRFGFSRRARLSLFLEGALLPPTESARLVRDNDSLRVKLEEVAADDHEELDDGFSYAAKDKKRHRQKQAEEEFSSNEDDTLKTEKKKNKHNPEYLSWRGEISVDVCGSHKKNKKRKRKEEVSGRNRHPEGKEENSADQAKKLKEAEKEKELTIKKKNEKQTKAAAAKMPLEQSNTSFSLKSGKNNPKKPTAQSRKKRGGSSDSSSTSSDSDSSDLHEKQNKSSQKPVVAPLPKDKPQAAANSDARTVVSNKVTVKSNAENSTKTAINKNAKKPQSSSSDSDSSTEDETGATTQSSAAKKSLPNTVAAVKTSSTKTPPAKTSSDSDSSDSETLVIKKPTANAGLNNSPVTNCAKQFPTTQGPLASSGRGRGRGTGEENFWRGTRGRGFHGLMRGQGRGRGANPAFFYNYNSEGQKQRQLNEAATNTSVVVQNPVEVPKRNYSVLPLLAAPPQVGERIAFKRLELTENYCPEVSDYKEGKIISWNADNKQIELEILAAAAGQPAKEPGKFDLVYESADGAQLIEYAVPQDTKITVSWDALIEPRLIVEPPVNGSNAANGTI